MKLKIFEILNSAQEDFKKICDHSSISIESILINNFQDKDFKKFAKIYLNGNLNDLWKWYIKYSKLYTDCCNKCINNSGFHSLWIEQILLFYYLRNKWIKLSFAKWDDNEPTHFIINDLVVQLYTNLNTVDELKAYIMRGEDPEIKNWNMYIELSQMINFQLMEFKGYNIKDNEQ